MMRICYAGGRMPLAACQHATAGHLGQPMPVVVPSVGKVAVRRTACCDIAFTATRITAPYYTRQQAQMNCLNFHRDFFT